MQDEKKKKQTNQRTANKMNTINEKYFPKKGGQQTREDILQPRRIHRARRRHYKVSRKNNTF